MAFKNGGEPGGQFTGVLRQIEEAKTGSDERC